MKINKLHIKNINSLKGEHVIDFNQPPLNQTGLFAITGPTGAGKSTLLDAISLALYNQIPRSGKISKNNILNFGTLITKGTNDCFAEIDFEVNGRKYRSKWEISRARTGNLRDYHMDLSEETEDNTYVSCGIKKSDIPAKNAEITGLNYEQFMKSIMLSQGDFARFLKANATERSELLEKITGTEIYRQIGKAAYEKLKEQEAIAQNIELKMQGISLLTEDEIDLINSKQKELKEQSVQAQKQVQEIQKQINEKELFEKKQQELSDARQQESILNNEKSKFESDLKRLDKHNQLISIKGELVQIKELNKQLESILPKTDKAKVEKQELTQYKQLLSKQSDQSKLALEKTQDDHKKLTPKIKKAVILDEQIKLKTEQSKQHQIEIDKHNKTCEEENRQIISHQKTVELSRKKLQNISEEINKKSALKNVPTTLSLIDQFMQEIVATNKQLKQQLQQLNLPHISENILGSHNWQQNKNYISQQISTIQQDLVQYNKELNLYTFSDTKDLNKQLLNANESENKLNELLSIQVQYLKENDLVKALQSQIKEEQSTCNKLRKELDEIAPKIKINQLKEKEISVRIERFKLEQSLENHRQNLEHNQPCPLCGSTEHPYVKQYEKSTSDLENQLKEIQQTLKKLEEQQQKQQQALIAAKTTLKNKTDQLTSLEKEQNKNLHLFQNKCKAIEIDVIIENSEFLPQKVKTERQNIEQLKKAVKLSSQKDLQSNQLLLLNPIKNNIEKIALQQQKSTDILAPFSEWIDDASNIKAKHDNLLILHEKFIKQQEEQAETEKQINQLSERIQLLKDQQKNNKKKSEELGQKHKLLTEDLKYSQKQRHLLLENKSTTSEQERIDLNLEKALKAQQKINEQFTLNSEQLKNIEKQLKIYNKEHSSIILNQDKLHKTLAEPLKQLSFITIEQTLQAFLSPDEEQAITQQQKQLNEQAAALKQKLNELLQFIKDNTEKISPTPKEELKQKHTEQQLFDQSLNKELGALEQQLKQNENNRKQTGSLADELKAQQKELKRWQNLNELIGDATGNKYSKFAQELTLQQMLSLANRHLIKLNPRYLLKYNPQQNEDLFVVDTLQGNEERSVRTLSGGESFLISLALALGLSDLAGKNTQLESLFIDEGFGSLDQVTLELALSTLERLQSESNRTIGVISHVEALKERISTQIELVKDSSGNSSISIH